MKKHIYFLILLSLLFLSCEKNVEVFGPEITTLNATAVSATQAKLNGTLTKLGSSAIVSIGFEYATDSLALANENGQRIEIAKSATTIPLNIENLVTGLNASTKYYYRAYAAMMEVEGQGKIISLTTQ